MLMDLFVSLQTFEESFLSGCFLTAFYYKNYRVVGMWPGSKSKANDAPGKFTDLVYRAPLFDVESASERCSGKNHIREGPGIEASAWLGERMSSDSGECSLYHPFILQNILRWHKYIFMCLYGCRMELQKVSINSVQLI